MNTDLLLAIADRIEAEPHWFNHSHWGRVYRLGETAPAVDLIMEPSSDGPHTRTCTTPCCVGGWAIILSGHELEARASMRDVAAALLQLTRYQARLLFQDAWPLAWLPEAPVRRQAWLDRLVAEGRGDPRLGSVFRPVADEAANVLRRIVSGTIPFPPVRLGDDPFYTPLP